MKSSKLTRLLLQFRLQFSTCKEMKSLCIGSQTDIYSIFPSIKPKFAWNEQTKWKNKKKLKSIKKNQLDSIILLGCWTCLYELSSILFQRRSIPFIDLVFKREFRMHFESCPILSRSVVDNIKHMLLFIEHLFLIHRRYFIVCSIRFGFHQVVTIIRQLWDIFLCWVWKDFLFRMHFDLWRISGQLNLVMFWELDWLMAFHGIRLA